MANEAWTRSDGGAEPPRPAGEPASERPAAPSDGVRDGNQTFPEPVRPVPGGVTAEPSGPMGTVSAVEEGGSVVLTGPLTVLSGENGAVSVEQITVEGVWQYGKDWEVTGGEAAPGRRIVVTGGTLSQDTDGSVRITGSTGNAVTLDMAAPSEAVLVEYDGTVERAAGTPSLSTLMLAAAVLCAAAVLFCLRRGRRAGARPKPAGAPEPAPAPSGPVRLETGKLHHIGRRPTQQDSLAVEEVPGGVFAVVADGMGGLSDGDRVSQTVVYTLLQDASGRTAAEIGDNLLPMVSRANAEVNRMLGSERQYRSGSTLAAALAEPDRFQWVSVGDSRVYLYRGGCLLQLNREHTYEADLLTKAVNREISFAEARSDERRAGLTSFIGMGALRSVDHSPRPVPARRGDRILVMSDGVFHTLSEEAIAAVLDAHPDAPGAASAIETAVLERNHPGQDNFTAIVIDYV